MDPTSFASILAGVKRMREQYDSETNVVSEEKILEPITGTGEEGTSKANNDSSDNKSVLKESSSNKENIQSSQRSSIIMTHRSSVQLYNQIQVSPSQKQNPLLQSPLMKQKPIVFNKEILSDYYINPTLQVLFLSLKYHQLHPEYLWRRIKRLRQGSSINMTNNRRDKALKILLVVIDIESPQEALRKLTNVCVKQDLTLIISWSFEQAGNYIAMFKENELSANQVNLSIKGVKNTDLKSSIIDTLTTIRSINKTDSINLIANFKNFKNIVKSEHVKIHGVGERKLQNMKNSFVEPFLYRLQE